MLHVAVLQQLSGFLPGGLGLAQLELHVRAGTDAVGHGNRTVAGIDTDQIAHQKGSFLLIRGSIALIQPRQGSVGCQFLTLDAEEQRMLHQFPIFGAEIGKHTLQTGHRTGAPVTLAQFEQHIALGLLDGEHRANGATTLGHHRIKTPAASDAEADGTGHHLIPQQQ